MKRIVICLDGTWNNTSRELEKKDRRVYRPTNVLKIARAVRAASDDGTTQIAYYDAGVGAMNRALDLRSKILKSVDNILGGAWGAGFEINIEEAYTFLSNNFEPGDEVYILGFSRGASQARSLTQLIEWAGGFPPKRDAYYVPKIFSRYLKDQGKGNVDKLLEEINESKRPGEEVTITPAGVTFLGVWDTVLALGWRILSGRGTTDVKMAYHTPSEAPANVEVVCQAIAIDEHRHDFQAEVWEGNADNLEQRWFAGAHSNIGGGLESDELANASLKWICQEATRAGLEFDERFLSFFSDNPYGKVLPKSTKYRILDTLLFPLRGFHGIRKIRGGCMKLDRSVIQRLNAKPDNKNKLTAPYRPKNLMDFLREDTSYDEQLSPEIRQELGRGKQE